MNARKPPPHLLVIAILQLVFGGLGLVCGLCGASVLAIGNQPFYALGALGGARNQPNAAEELEKFINQRLPIHKPIQYVTAGVDIGLSLLMIIGGIGLLGMRSWARILTILYALLSVSMKVFQIAYTAFVTVPIFREFAQTFGAKGQQEALAAKSMQFAAYFGIAGPVIFLIYPAIVLVFMLLPATTAAFRSQTESAVDVLPADEP